MGVSKKNSNGFKGKVGTTVTYPLKGQMVERTVGENTNDPTAMQQQTRQKTTLITALLAPVMDYIRIGFKVATEKTLLSPYNLATSINWLEAITGVYPNQEIDFSRAVFSKGKMPPDTDVKVVLNAGGMEFSWNAAAILAGTKLTDSVMVMAYCPEKKLAFCITDGARRREGSEQLNLPKYRSKTLFHTYITFVASNLKSNTNSMYLGGFMR